LAEKEYNPTDFYMPAEWEPHKGTWLQWPQPQPLVVKKDNGA